ncbi:MAG: sterol desaturase family protein [Myxococcales bacterium]|nr:sterol desaturase family protein [Myxococcales bacterium]
MATFLNSLTDLSWLAVQPTSFSWKLTGFVMLAVFAAVFLRYVIFSGSAYLIFWKWLPKRFHHRRIQQRFPKSSILKLEFLWSLSTFVIFSMTGALVFWLTKMGYTLRYKHISDYGWGYFFFSIILMILVHDTYFYWTHRAMHHKSLFRYFHRVHHLSYNPSPWAAFSFHPLEAVVEAGIIYVIVFFIPYHAFALLSFLIFMTVMNVLGHLGYELYPKGFTKHPIGQWFNTSTHHNLHHHKGKLNFSLYFNWWDRWMGTNQEGYHEAFDEVASRPKPETVEESPMLPAEGAVARKEHKPPTSTSHPKPA